MQKCKAMRWNGKRIVIIVSHKLKYCKNFERNSHWRKLSMIMVWERYCNASPKTRILFIFFVYIFIRISANISPFGLKFSQMILHTETSKLMYNLSFLFVVLHKPTLLPSTFNSIILIISTLILTRMIMMIFKSIINVKVQPLYHNKIPSECNQNNGTVFSCVFLPDIVYSNLNLYLDCLHCNYFRKISYFYAIIIWIWCYFQIYSV